MIRRRKPLVRKTPINRAPTKRRRARTKKLFGPGTQAAFCRSLPCLACVAVEAKKSVEERRPVPPRSDPAHIRARNVGGDLGNVVSLCRSHHMQQHAKGWGWMEQTYGVDFNAEAARLARVVAKQESEAGT